VHSQKGRYIRRLATDSKPKADGQPKKKRSVKSNPWSSFLLDRCEMVNTVPHGKSITGDGIPTSLAIKGQFYIARSLTGQAQIWGLKTLG